MTNYGMVREWHTAFHVPVHDVPHRINYDRRDLRRELIREETTELTDAMLNGDIIGVADGLADLLYVVYGTAAEYGIPVDDVFREVHRSNMTKLGEDGQPIYRADGKVLKGPRWTPPNIELVLREAGWMG